MFVYSCTALKKRCKKAVANFFKQLKALKDRPEAGGLDRAAHEANKAHLLQAIGHVEKTDVSSPVYYSWIARSFISKPMAVGVSGFLILTSGWMTTVNASSNSLPGERLYSVKIIAEKAQLQLASLDRRAVLHTEFAERRLVEATELRAQVVEVKPELVQEAMDAYKKELASAQDDLQEMKEENDKATVDAATEVQQKLESLEVVIDAAAAASATPEASAEVLAAKESSRAVEVVAIDAVVEAHEDVATAQSEQDVSEMFRRQLGALEARGTFDEHRLETIRVAIAANPARLGHAEVVVDDELKRMSGEIEAALKMAPEAMNAFALDGVRTAFDTLQAADAILLAIESRIAEIEITITTVLMEAEE